MVLQQMVLQHVAPSRQPAQTWSYHQSPHLKLLRETLPGHLARHLALV